MFRFTIRDVLWLTVVFAISFSTVFADEPSPTLKELVRQASEDRSTPFLSSPAVAVLSHLACHVRPEWRGSRHLLVISKFSGDGRTVLRYSVTEAGICDYVREVYLRTSQDWHQHSVVSDPKRLSELLAQLPESKAEPPIDRTIHVSFQASGKWRTETYDASALPDRLQEVMKVLEEVTKVVGDQNVKRVAIAEAAVTAEQVDTAISRGIAFLEKQQLPDGRWSEMVLESGGVTALCTLALLDCGRTPADESVKKALAFLERSKEPSRIYSVSLTLMVFARADPHKYAPEIKKLAAWIEGRQLRNAGTHNGGWRYTGIETMADNSSTQFAVMALHEAEKAGIRVSNQTWQLALNYWTQPGMQLPSGAFAYQVNQRDSTGSMTCAGIASLIIIRDRLQQGGAKVVDGNIQCCGSQPSEDRLANAFDWLGQNFSAERNPNHVAGIWWLYYLHALERVGRMSGQRYFVTSRPGKESRAELHDWYREGCQVLVEKQDKFNNFWVGIGAGETSRDVGTALALLFLSKGRRPVVIAKLQHHPDAGMGSLDWDHHRRAVQNLTLRVEEKWQRDLSWQTIDFTRRTVREAGAVRDAVRITTADLLEAPVLFLSGSQALDFNDDQRRMLKEYLENGGFLFAEACSGNGCDGEAFDRSFRALMRELFPDSELRKLPPNHAVWYAQEKVDTKHLPKDSEFWLWGLDTGSRTSVVYCPRSLSCYWELAHPYRESEYRQDSKEKIEQVTRIGINVLAYATSRELKEKLDRPQLARRNPGGKSRAGALTIPKLSHGGDADSVPNSLNYLLQLVEARIDTPVDFEKLLISPTDPKLLEYPIVFMHGRRSFRFSDAERKGLKVFLDRGGFLFAEAISSNQEFADSFRAEMKAIYPESEFSPIPNAHSIYTEAFSGFPITSVTLRNVQARSDDGPLTVNLAESTPLLESMTINDRKAVVLSPFDISRVITGGHSLEHTGYISADAARIGANVFLYALQRKISRVR